MKTVLCTLIITVGVVSFFNSVFNNIIKEEAIQACDNKGVTCEISIPAK